MTQGRTFLLASGAVTIGLNTDTPDAFGAYWFCVDEQTEIMTNDGWKPYTEIAAGDTVLTLNHETGLSEWQPLLAVNVFPAATRQMLSMEGRGHSSLTTLDHRWAVESRSHWRGRTYLTRCWKTSATLAWDDRIPVAAPCASLPSEPKYQDALVELVAWFWTEGTIDSSSKKGARLYQSYSANPQHCAAIRATLTSLFGPAYATGGRAHPVRLGHPGWRETQRPSTGMSVFFLNDAAAALVLAHMDERKIVHPRFIASLTAAQLRLFIDRSVDGDGHWGYCPDRKSGADTFSQGIEERHRTFEMACALLGIRTNTYRSHGPESHPIGSRMVTSRGPQFFTTLVRSSRISPKAHAQNIVQHPGVIWCPTTPNGTWLARRRGTVYFTGNCFDVDGWDSPEIRQKLQDRQGEHGVIVTESMLGARIMTVKEGLAFPTGNEQARWDAMDRLAIVTNIVDGASGTLTATEGTLVRQCAVQRAAGRPLMEPLPDADAGVKYGHVWPFRFTVVLLAQDPRRYSAALNGPTALPASIVNAGDFPTKPTLTVTGGGEGTTITLGAMSVILTSAYGAVPSPLIIDLLNQTAVDGGGANQMQAISGPTQWWSLQPGANAVGFAGPGAATITWRDSWS